MRHRNAGKRLGRRSEEKLALARNLTMSLFERFGNEREFITTSITKAKWVKPFAEKAITLGVKGYKELQKAADANGTTIAELRKQQDEGDNPKKFKDLPAKVREHLTRSIAYRRQAAAQLRDAGAVRTLFDKVAERYLDRPGGYLRVIKTSKIQIGDATEQAILGFVESKKK